MSLILPEIALSIRQPYCHNILYDEKDIENRNWPTRLRGPVLIHASKGFDREDKDEIFTKSMPRGGVVGIMEIVDCVTDSPSRWFYGRYGFVIRNVMPLPFMPCKGRLGFFRPDIDYAALTSLINATHGRSAIPQPAPYSVDCA